MERYLSDPAFWILSAIAVASFFVGVFFSLQAAYVEGRLEYDRRKELEEEARCRERVTVPRLGMGP